MSRPPAAFSTDLTIDTDACTGHDGVGAPLSVTTLPINQTSAPGVCVLIAGAFDVQGIVATGDRALALVSPGPIVIRGFIDEAARKPFNHLYLDGPGALTTGACVGQIGGNASTTESGGGANATDGGAGKTVMVSSPLPISGGVAQVNFSPLVGGCQGGQPYLGGGGGGALQLVSFTSIEIAQGAMLSFGGAGGTAGGYSLGGGAGGTIELEAPRVSIFGGIAANGGAGAYSTGTCFEDGADATPDNVPAPAAGATCGIYAAGGGGAGGTGTSMPGSSVSGGGSVGRILIRTEDGTFTGPGPIFSIAPTTDILMKQ